MILDIHPDQLWAIVSHATFRLALAAVVQWLEATLDGVRARVFFPPKETGKRGSRRSKPAQVAHATGNKVTADLAAEPATNGDVHNLVFKTAHHTAARVVASSSLNSSYSSATDLASSAVSCSYYSRSYPWVFAVSQP